MTDDITPSDVLSFWFAPEQQKRWFDKDEAFDADIRTRFLSLYEQATSGRLDGWGKTAEGALALVIVLDQFPRNMFRGQVRAFESDAKALALVKNGIAKGLDRQLRGDHLSFFYMPLMHAENIKDQDLSVELFTKAGLAENIPYAIAHRVIIARFGAFPHRNEILGRTSTAEEIEFLKGPNSSF